MKNINNNVFLSSLYVFYIFLPSPLLKVLSEEKSFNLKGENNIIWNSVDIDENFFEKKINWSKYKENESLINKTKNMGSKELFSDDKDGGNILDYLKDFKVGYQKANYLESFIPTNNFLGGGDKSYSIFWKSTFNGGASGGTGQQNNSFRFDYGINDDLQFTGYFSEADDDLFNLIDGKTIPYFWQNYSISLKKRLFENKKLDFSLSIVPTIEYWRSSSGSKFVKSIFNQKDNELGKEKFNIFIGSISVPLSKKINKKLDITFSPGITFMPEKIGNKNIGKNFYGNNLFLGTGLIYELKDNLNIFSSYAFPLGPGDNYFDKYLKFSNKSIYSFGFNWDVNPMIGLEAKITNSFGSTPSTGLLTIPSDNLPLYYAGLSYKPNMQDTNLKILSDRERSISFGGLTVNNALIPEFDISQISFDYDSKGNIFASYKYSLSNIFQIQLLDIGGIRDLKSKSLKENRFQKTFFNDKNLNFRIGGKLLLLTPQKDDKFWMSKRISLGRNNQNNQGYIFSELSNTFKINNSFLVNINPKYFHSGIGSLGALGLSSYIYLNDKLILIPEFNKVFTNYNSNNLTFSIRYSYDPLRSMDVYLTNALGNQDLSQFMKTSNYKVGIRFNFLY